MATLGLLGPDGAERDRLGLIAGECGHAVRGAHAVLEAVELLREARPKVMLLLDAPGHDAAAALRELLRASPLLPVVVALHRRDAARAVKLMRLGAAEVVAPPWTREALEAVLAKAARYQGTALKVVRTRAASRWPYFALAVCLFFAAALGRASWLRRERLALEAAQVRTSWDLPYRHPAGMAFEGGSLWVADWFSQSLYAHAPADASVRRLVHFPADMPVAVAMGAGAGWTVTATGAVVKHQLDAKWTVLDRLPGLGVGATGLVYDGLYLWLADAKGRRLQKRLPDARLSLVASYKYPGQEPTGLAFDGRSLWSLDGPNRRLVRHNLERPDEALEEIPLPEYSDGKYRAAGAAWDGGRFWTVGERMPRGSGPARLFQHPPRGEVR